MKKALVLHSGGLDSTLCLLLAQEKGREVISLGIDYGQRHRIELEYAKAQCRRFGFHRRVVQVNWNKPHRDIPLKRSPEQIRSGGISPAFLPARNAVFLTLACAETAAIEATEVWIGINAVDFSGYPDCTPEFLETFKRMMFAAYPSGPEIVAPLIGLSKSQIAAECKRLGLTQGDTWSCYQPKFTAAGIVPCGECDACVLHSLAWKQAT